MFKARLQDYIDGRLSNIASNIYIEMNLVKSGLKTSSEIIRGEMETDFYNICKDEKDVDRCLMQVRELTRAVYRAKTGDCTVC